MARRLHSGNNEMELTDNLSKSRIVLNYRLPTTKERVKYTADCIQRQGTKIIDKTTEVRIRDGKKILTSIREGDFEIPSPDGRDFVPLASDADSKNYKSNWKDLVEECGSDILEFLAIQVFDIPVQIARDGDGAIVQSEDAGQD